MSWTTHIESLTPFVITVIIVITMENDLLLSNDKAYKRLRQAIFENELPKGKFLSQRMLAKMADTSVVSVREALKKLEYEGLIESIPRWGVKIPIVTKKSLEESYIMREAIEVMAAYLISKSITSIKKEKVAILKNLAKQCDSMPSVGKKYAPQFYEKHMELHRFLISCTNNSLLLKEFDRLNLRQILFHSAKVTWAKRIENWEHWHRDLVEEILSGDPQRAQEAMHRHIQHGLRHDLENFE